MKVYIIKPIDESYNDTISFDDVYSTKEKAVKYLESVGKIRQYHENYYRAERKIGNEERSFRYEICEIEVK